MIYNGIGRPKKNYYVPKIERPKYTELDKNEWQVGAITKNAVSSIKKAILRTGGNREALIRLVVSEEDMALFTPNVENRLLSLFRNIFNGIVLLEIHSPEKDLKQSRNSLLKRAEKEHKKRLKEHEQYIDSEID